MQPSRFMKAGKRINTLGAFIALAGVSLVAAAGDIEVQYELGGIAFQLPENQASVLILSGEGVYMQQRFDAGDWPFLDAIDKSGYMLSDGNYKYELRTIPEVEDEAVAEADRNGDEQRLAELWKESEEQAQIISGWFEIVDGRLIPTQEVD